MKLSALCVLALVGNTTFCHVVIISCSMQLICYPGVLAIYAACKSPRMLPVILYIVTTKVINPCGGMKLKHCDKNSDSLWFQ